jgi:hypothetical protein
VFVVASDVACPLASVLAAPISAPPDTHPCPVTSAGWHRKNTTVPVGVGCPAPPATVAVSVTDVPGDTFVLFVLACVAVVDGCLATVKHSLTAFVWLEGW